MRSTLSKGASCLFRSGSVFGRAILLGCVSGAALLVLAVGQASAATYPGGGSTFTGSAEGWKVASSPEKSCNLLDPVENRTVLHEQRRPMTARPVHRRVRSRSAPTSRSTLISIFKSDVTAESPAFTAVGSGSGSLAFSRSFARGSAHAHPAVHLLGVSGRQNDQHQTESDHRDDRSRSSVRHQNRRRLTDRGPHLRGPDRSRDHRGPPRSACSAAKRRSLRQRRRSPVPTPPSATPAKKGKARRRERWQQREATSGKAAKAAPAASPAPGSKA